MKKNKLNLITAFLNLLAGVCFMIAAAAWNETVSKGLSIAASICFLISSIGFLCTYVKNRKNSDEKDG